MRPRSSSTWAFQVTHGPGVEVEQRGPTDGCGSSVSRVASPRPRPRPWLSRARTGACGGERRAVGVARSRCQSVASISGDAPPVDPVVKPALQRRCPRSASGVGRPVVQSVAQGNSARAVPPRATATRCRAEWVAPTSTVHRHRRRRRSPGQLPGQHRRAAWVAEPGHLVAHRGGAACATGPKSSEL